LNRRLSSAELTEWEVYSSIEPWGDELADIHHGILCTVIANSFASLQATTVQLQTRKRAKKQKSGKPTDYMVLNRPPKKKQSQENMLQMVEHLNAAFGGKDLRKS